MEEHRKVGGGGGRNRRKKKKKRKERNRKSTLCVKPVRSNECCSSLFLTILDTSSFRWSLVVDSNRNYTTTYVISGVKSAVHLQFRSRFSYLVCPSLPLSSTPSRDSPSFFDFHSYFLFSLLNSFFFFSFSFRRRKVAIFFFSYLFISNLYKTQVENTALCKFATLRSGQLALRFVKNSNNVMTMKTSIILV